MTVSEITPQMRADNLKIYVQLRIVGFLSDEYEVADRWLVRRRKHNLPVELREGVRIIGGKFPAFGGSRENPRLIDATTRKGMSEDPVIWIEIYVPVATYLAIFDECGDSLCTWSMTPTPSGSEEQGLEW